MWFYYLWVMWTYRIISAIYVVYVCVAYICVGVPHVIIKGILLMWRIWLKVIWLRNLRIVMRTVWRNIRRMMTHHIIYWRSICCCLFDFIFACFCVLTLRILVPFYDFSWLSFCLRIVPLLSFLFGSDAQISKFQRFYFCKSSSLNFLFSYCRRIFFKVSSGKPLSTSNLNF